MDKCGAFEAMCEILTYGTFTCQHPGVSVYKVHHIPTRGILWKRKVPLAVGCGHHCGRRWWGGVGAVPCCCPRMPRAAMRIPWDIYLSSRITRPCRTEVWCPLSRVHPGHGELFYKGPTTTCTVKSVPRMSSLHPAVISIHLDLPDEEPFVHVNPIQIYSSMFKELSNHLARVEGEPKSRGLYFHFVRCLAGRQYVRVKDTCLYYISLQGAHKKHKVRRKDFIKIVVNLVSHAADNNHDDDNNEFQSPNNEVVSGMEVLARCEEDGWYYRGRIQHKEGRKIYSVIQDFPGRIEVVTDEDIHPVRGYLGDPSTTTTKEYGRYVLARHPIYHWLYAPGLVIGVQRHYVNVRFYDDQESDVPRHNVYPARNRVKHLKDVEDIQQREKDWEGMEAVIRDESGVYRLGRVNKQIGRQQRYTVTWEDGQCGEQMSIHIYGTFSKMIKFKVDSYILALVDSDSAHFLPGQVRKVTTLGDADVLDVVFIDGRRSNTISTDSYLMSEMLYEEAVAFYREHHSDM
ncbi:uncharacterized protein LOC124139605 isoform X1 [Haliotis rufescens]|uniref:uncharacterized protein LOC124139605 isoform X1 n=1 Tax=Haliotis rufescens TaxID=6454 RepID=UPI00201F8199|nr:uncharacterized protein LOC124139605 isoform X1 [Haliotis rufescens]